jgi:pterin-4a-carbinolamine dehydratase
MSQEFVHSVNKSKPAAGGRQRLKSERVQQELKSERVQQETGGARQRLKSERVQELLRGIPAWGLADTGTAIGREWRFPRPRVAAAYAAYVAGLAAAEGQTVHLVLSGAAVSLKLTGNVRGGSRNGLTEKVFRFATRLG